MELWLTDLPGASGNVMGSGIPGSGKRHGSSHITSAAKGRSVSIPGDSGPDLINVQTITFACLKKTTVMRPLLNTIILLLMSTVITGQQDQLVAKSTAIRVTVIKDGKRTEWEKKNVAVMLNYKTGKFISRIKNTDLQRTEIVPLPAQDTAIVESVFTLTGTFPINELINQHLEKQQYKIELELVNEELEISETLLFDMLITRPESTSDNGFRVFSLNGVLHNDQLDLPAFEGFEDEIGLWLMFSGTMNNVR